MYSKIENFVKNFAKMAKSPSKPALLGGPDVF